MFPPRHASRIQVCVRHGNAFVTRGVEAALSQQADIELVGEAGQAQSVSDQPQVFVVDYLSGLALARARAAGGTPARLNGKLLVVAPADQAHAVRSALQAGVDGYLSMDCAVRDLMAGIRQLACGARYLEAAAAQCVAGSLQQTGLTARQHQVLVLVAAGASNKHVAQSLDITAGTVKSHMKAILGKLEARSRTHAMRIALDRGLLDAEARRP
jgi:DNA-binding NarL/FixJ family response regulator